MPVRIVLADDHPVIRSGVGVFAQNAGIEIVSQVESASDIPDVVQNLRPDVLVTEVRLASHDALKAIEDLPTEGHPCRVVVFSSLTNTPNIARASALGCHEFSFIRSLIHI